MSNRRKGRDGGSDFGRDEPNGFRNPQFGPGTKVYDAGWEKNIKLKLEQFKNSDSPELRFDKMENHLRRRIHELARRMELNSTSTGRDPFRLVVVTHRKKTENAIAASTARDTQPIRLTESQKDRIDEFIERYPITQLEIDKHLEAKFDKKSRHNHGDRRQNMMNDPLVPPPSNSSYEMKQSRCQLPAYCKKESLLRAIEKNDVTLITGGTGCGKTTQVPQFLLEHYEERKIPIRIVCTQPRRLPAIAVAERVCRERGEKLGSTVGYHIRLEQRTTDRTILTYCTSGVLLRMLTIDELATGVTHIILDEVHEREQNTDYLLIALKEALDKRKDLKVILMSATMEGNIDMFMRYFNKYSIEHIEIQSRLFNVRKFFLGEVLAMTGYCPPDSPFGSVGFFDVNGSSSTTTTNTEKFPRVESWVCNSGSNNFHSLQQLPESQTVPNLASLTGSHGMSVLSHHSALSNSASTSNLQTQTAQRPHDFHNLALQLARHSVNDQPQQQTSSRGHVGFPTTAFGQKPVQYAHSSVYSQQGAYNTHPMQYQQQMSWPDGHVADVVDLPCSDEEDAKGYESIHGYPGSSAHQDQMQSHSMTYSNTQNQWPNIAGQSQSQQHIGQSAWQHTQSFSGVACHSQMQQQPPTHSWDSRSTQQQYPSNYAQESKAGFYLADSEVSHPNFYPQQGLDQYGLQHNYQQQQPPPPIVLHPNRGYSGGFTQLPYTANSPMSEVDKFGNQIREQEAEALRMRLNLTTALRDRPPSFEWSVCEKLSNARLDSASLVNMYLKCGGSQWIDTVDLDLCNAVINYCMDSSIEGSILVFLPGFDDITTLSTKVLAGKSKRTPLVYTLHSQMNSHDQQRVFEPAPPGCRKVILSTNIAEASLTIDDVVFVIDCGKVKEKTYDHESRISQLKVAWIAKSNAEQRSGRAGRCREGFCFRLYSVGDHNVMLPTQVAEMQRAAIHDVCLHAKMYAPENVSVRDFLDMAPEPPSREAVSNSLQFLEQLGALYNESANKCDHSQVSMMQFTFGRGRREHELTRDPDLTDLGRFIAQLPLEPQLARLLLFGLVLKCFSPVVTLVAALSHREPFVITSPEQRSFSLEARDEFGRRDLSDHLMLIRAYNEFAKQNPRQQSDWCKRKYMAYNTMKMIGGIRRQLVTELKRVNMIKGDHEDPEINKYSNCWPMVQAAIVAGCYPGIGFVRNNNKLRKIRTSYDGAATLHPSSVIKRQLASSNRWGENMKRYAGDSPEPIIEYMVFQELARIEEGLTLRCVTVVTPLSVVLFGGAIRLKKGTIDCFNIVSDEEGPAAFRDETPSFESWILDLEQWLAVRGDYQELRRVLQLRFRFMSYFLKVMREPQDIYTNKHNDLLEVISVVLMEEHKRFSFKEVSDLPKGKDMNQTIASKQNFSNNNFAAHQPAAYQTLSPRENVSARESDSHIAHGRRIESSCDVRSERSAQSSHSNSRFHEERDNRERRDGENRERFKNEREGTYGGNRNNAPKFDNVYLPEAKEPGWSRGQLPSQRERDVHHSRDTKRSFFGSRQRDHRSSRSYYNHYEYEERVPEDPPQSSRCEEKEPEIPLPPFEDDWEYDDRSSSQQQSSKSTTHHNNQSGGGGSTYRNKGSAQRIREFSRGGGNKQRYECGRFGVRDEGSNEFNSNNSGHDNGGRGRSNRGRGKNGYGGERGGSREWCNNGYGRGGHRNNQNVRD